MEILCGQCGRNISIGEAGIVGAKDSTVTCPHCGHSILVPRIDGLDIADGTNAAVAPQAPGEAPALPDEEEGFAASARQAMQKKIRAVCGSCGKGLSINPRHAGRAGRCPSCGGKIQIPKLPEEEIDFPAGGQLEGDIVDIELIEEHGEGGDPAAVAAHGESGGEASGRDAHGTGHLPNPLVPIRDDAAPADAAHQANADPFLEPAAVTADAAAHAALAGDSGDWTATEDERSGESPQAQSPMGRARWLKPVIALGCVCLVGVVGLATFLNVRHKAQEPVADQATENRGQDAHATGQPAGQGVAGAQTTPASSIAGGGPGTEHPQPSAGPSAAHTGVPAYASGSCRVAAGSFGVFAPGGQLPAAPDRLYCTIQATISAGRGDVRLDLAKDVTLSVDGTDFACLGLPADGGDGLRRAKRSAPIAIPAGGEKTLTLVFEVPASARAGKLKIGGVAETTAIFDRPQPAPADAQLAGAWAEISPRALVPLLKDPVCAAIQDTPPSEQRLIVSVAKDTVALRMPAAGVEGVATKIPDSDGLFDAELTSRGDTLKCKLRLAQGPRLVLYLQNEPFHQLVLGKAPPQTTQAAR